MWCVLLLCWWLFSKHCLKEAVPPRYHCESLEHATTCDHVIAVTADFQKCIEDGTVSQIVRQHTLAATAALTLA